MYKSIFRMKNGINNINCRFYKSIIYWKLKLNGLSLHVVLNIIDVYRSIEEKACLNFILIYEETNWNFSVLISTRNGIFEGVESV